MTGADPSAATTLHASCVVLGEDGLLIRGVSGSGKSTLALALVRERRRDGGFARLVADDRVRITVAHGRLVARPVAPLAGLVEVRGIGLTAATHEPACVLRLVVDLDEREPERMPDPADLETCLLGIVLPRLAARSFAGPVRPPMAVSWPP